MTSKVGIDYGSGTSNIDLKTGIRYGVISINRLHSDVWGEFEPEYGDPVCPHCGSKLSEAVIEKDYFCESCVTDSAIEGLDELEEYSFWSDEVIPDEPLYNYLKTDKYSATVDGYNDVFLVKSPYYTFCQFCSPCAPGAGHLENPIEGGVKTFCFGPEMFDEDKAPYPVYRVDDDSLVYRPDGE